MSCPYLKRYDTRAFSGECISPEGPLLNKLKREDKSRCDTDYFTICSYCTQAQTDLSRLRQARLSGR